MIEKIRNYEKKRQVSEILSELDVLTGRIEAHLDTLIDSVGRLTPSQLDAMLDEHRALEIRAETLRNDLSRVRPTENERKRRYDQERRIYKN